MEGVGREGGGGGEWREGGDREREVENGGRGERRWIMAQLHVGMNIQKYT